MQFSPRRHLDVCVCPTADAAFFSDRNTVSGRGDLCKVAAGPCSVHKEALLKAHQKSYGPRHAYFVVVDAMVV